jgi:hypothetical protein
MKGMMALPLMALTLGGCAASQASYGLDYGDANYDALKAATDSCRAKGGVIRLKGGYDGRRLENYVCEIGQTRKSGAE